MTGREPEIRFNEHATAIGTGKEVLNYDVFESGLTLDQARGLEQQLINYHGLGRNGGELLNKINSVATAKWSRMGIVPPTDKLLK